MICQKTGGFCVERVCAVRGQCSKKENAKEDVSLVSHLREVQRYLYDDMQRNPESETIRKLYRSNTAILLRIDKG